MSEVTFEHEFVMHEAGRVFPFVEDEDCNITGYGHQDKAEFARLVNEYDAVCGNEMPGGEEYDDSDVAHDWVVLNGDGESLRYRDVSESTPGAFPVTTMWGLR